MTRAFLSEYLEIRLHKVWTLDLGLWTLEHLPVGGIYDGLLMFRFYDILV